MKLHDFRIFYFDLCFEIAIESGLEQSLDLGESVSTDIPDVPQVRAVEIRSDQNRLLLLLRCHYSGKDPKVGSGQIGLLEISPKTVCGAEVVV